MAHAIEAPPVRISEELNWRAPAGEDEVNELSRDIEAWLAERGESVTPLDWQELLDAGAGPGLALGAERRFRRS